MNVAETRPGSGGSGDGGSSSGGLSAAARRAFDRLRGRGDDEPDRPTGVAGPDDTPEGGGSTPDDPSRPTGVAGPDDTPEGGDEVPSGDPIGSVYPDQPSDAPRGARRAVEQTPGGSGGESRRDTTRTGARGAVENTPDEKVDPNASVRTRFNRVRRRSRARERRQEPGVVGPTAGARSPRDVRTRPAGDRTRIDDIERDWQRFSRSVERGGSASEGARDILDTSLDVAFNEEGSRFVGEALGLDESRTRSDDITLSGPEVNLDASGFGDLLTSGPEGDINREVVDILASGEGPLSDRQRRDLRRDIEARERALDFSEGAESFIRDVTGSDEAATVAGVAGRTPADLATWTADVTLAGDAALGAAGRVPESVEQEGAVDTAESIANVAGMGIEQTTTAAEENPVEFGATLARDVLAGSAAVRGLGRANQYIDNVRTRRGADAVVDFEDISTSRAAEGGDLPEFDTSPTAPTSEAVAEVRDRASDVPEGIQRLVDSDRALFRSESNRLDADLDVGEGQYELPGLFTSPDASPLRLDFGSERSSIIPDIRLPRPSDFTPSRQRLSAFEGDRIEGMPTRAAESGRLFDQDAPRPNPSTGGYRFLTDEGAPGTAYVRATGDRTTELEAIFPPGSRFTRGGTAAVNLPGGDVGTLDIFRRLDVDAGDVVDDIDGAVARGSEVFDVSDITRRSRRTDVDGTPVFPPVSVPSPTTTGPTSAGGTGTSGGPAGTSGGSGGGGSPPPSEPSPPSDGTTSSFLAPASPSGSGASPDSGPPSSSRPQAGGSGSLPPSQPPERPSGGGSTTSIGSVQPPTGGGGGGGYGGEPPLGPDGPTPRIPDPDAKQKKIEEEGKRKRRAIDDTFRSGIASGEEALATLDDPLPEFEPPTFNFGNEGA